MFCRPGPHLPFITVQKPLKLFMEEIDLFTPKVALSVDVYGVRMMTSITSLFKMRRFVDIEKRKIFSKQLPTD